MSADAPVDPTAAFAVLWYFGNTAGRDPGQFVAALLEAMAQADLTNRARLVAAFPEYGRAFLVGKSARDGIDRLCSIVQAVAA